jgi:hypothetical protein
MAQSRRCSEEHAASQPSYDGIGKPQYWADAVSAMPIQIVGDRCESPVTLSSSRTAHAYLACGMLGVLEAAQQPLPIVCREFDAELPEVPPDTLCLADRARCRSPLASALQVRT